MTRNIDIIELRKYIHFKFDSAISKPLDSSLSPDIVACSFDIEETSISKFFCSFDIEVLNFYIEVLDFDIEDTQASI